MSSPSSRAFRTTWSRSTPPTAKYSASRIRSRELRDPADRGHPLRDRPFHRRRPRRDQQPRSRTRPPQSCVRLRARAGPESGRRLLPGRDYPRPDETGAQRPVDGSEHHAMLCTNRSPTLTWSSGPRPATRRTGSRSRPRTGKRSSKSRRLRPTRTTRSTPWANTSSISIGARRPAIKRRCFRHEQTRSSLSRRNRYPRWLRFARDCHAAAHGGGTGQPRDQVREHPG